MLPDERAHALATGRQFAMAATLGCARDQSK